MRLQDPFFLKEVESIQETTLPRDIVIRLIILFLFVFK